MPATKINLLGCAALSSPCISGNGLVNDEEAVLHDFEVGYQHRG